MFFSAWHQCVRGCAGRYDIFEVIYRYPACGGLPDVGQDVEGELGSME